MNFTEKEFKFDVLLLVVNAEDHTQIHSNNGERIDFLPSQHLFANKANGSRSYSNTQDPLHAKQLNEGITYNFMLKMY